MLTNNSPLHCRPLIQWCLFKQYSFTLAVEWQGNQGPQEGALTAPASQQLMNLVVEKVQFLVHGPHQARPVCQTPTARADPVEWQWHREEPGRTTLAQKRPHRSVFLYKKFNKYYFSKFIARNNTSKMHFYVHITLIGQYKVSARSQWWTNEIAVV